MAPTLNPRRLRILLGALGLLGLAGAWDGWQWLRARDWNAQIAGGSIVKAAPPLPAEAQFAQAWYLSRAGNLQRALSLYQELTSRGEPALAGAARYNIGNLFLREALRARGGGDPREAFPYLELAKQSYREALRHEPERWETRYNLERALRLSPESGEAESGEGPAPLPSERAATTMHGFTLGLP